MSASELLREGNARFERGEYQEALQIFSEALEPILYGDVPVDVDIDVKTQLLSQRSICYAQLKQYLEALEDGRYCVDANPESTDGYCRCGEAYELFGFRVKALQSYEAALNINPSDEEIKKKKEKLEARKGEKRNKENPFLDHDLMDRILGHPDMDLLCDDEEIIPMMAEIRKDPNIYDFLKQYDKRIVEVAEYLIEIEDIADCFVDGVYHPYRRRRKPLDPDKYPKLVTVPRVIEPPISEILATFTTVKECKEKAIEREQRYRFLDGVACYRKLQELEPDEIQHIYDEGRQWSGAFKFEKALEVYERFFEAAKHENEDDEMKKKMFICHKNIAYGYYHKGDYENSVIYYDLAHEYLSTDYVVELNRKYSYKYRHWNRKKKHFDKERAHEEKELGKRYFNAMRLQKAVEHFTEAIKCEPDKYVRGRCYRKRGTCYYYLKEYDKAIFDAEKSLNRAKRDNKYMKGHFVKFESLMEKVYLAEGQARRDLRKKWVEALRASQEWVVFPHIRTLRGFEKAHLEMFPNEEKTYNEFMADISTNDLEF